MLSTMPGVVENVLWSRKGLQCLEIRLEGKKEKALNYTGLTGTALPGQQVLLNTTAVKLKLGSGGFHFVIANQACQRLALSPHGHIMKLRYTPLQFKVQTYEEILNNKGSRLALKQYPGLKNTPVIIGELHSMVAPFVLMLKNINPAIRIVYIMTDSAALPLYLSNAVHHLQTDGLLAGTVTYGQAFGGDLETVNIYTALIAAKEYLNADVILLAPGPGVVGTATRYGHSGIEQGEHVDRVHKFQGLPVVIPRISFAEKRDRHYGLSHHVLTALSEISEKKAYLPLPRLSREKVLTLYKQLRASGLLFKHKIILINKTPRFNLYAQETYKLQSMGRGLQEDPVFFAAIAATACFCEKLLQKNK